MKKLLLIMFLSLFLMNFVSAVTITDDTEDTHFWSVKNFPPFCHYTGIPVEVDDCDASLTVDENWSSGSSFSFTNDPNVFVEVVYNLPSNVESVILEIKYDLQDIPGLGGLFTAYCYNGNGYSSIFSDDSEIGINQINYTISDTNCFSGDTLTMVFNATGMDDGALHIYEEQIHLEITTESILVDPYETIILPQIASTVLLDIEGLQRTYLYCTWRIDDIGEEGVLMNGEICPETQQIFQFENDETYFTRIDFATIGFSQISNEWEIITTGIAGDINQIYILDVPEPPQSLLDSIGLTILNLVKGILCNIFPGLGLCS